MRNLWIILICSSAVVTRGAGSNLICESELWGRVHDHHAGAAADFRQSQLWWRGDSHNPRAATYFHQSKLWGRIHGHHALIITSDQNRVRD